MPKGLNVTGSESSAFSLTVIKALQLNCVNGTFVGLKKIMIEIDN